MSTFRFARVAVPAWALLVVAIASLACGESAPQERQGTAEQPSLTVPAAEPTMARMGKEPAGPTTPAVTPLPEPETLRVVAQGFGQDGQDLGFAFLVENPSADLAFESTQYRVAAYDDAGTLLGTDAGYVELILPGQTLGVAGTMRPGHGRIVSQLEVQLLERDSSATDPGPTFTVESSAFCAGEYSRAATGIVASPYGVDLTDIRVSAVMYDEGGEIIGGGRTYLNFILAESTTGVEVPVTASGEVAAVEIYPVFSALTFLREETELPAGAGALALTKHGFGQDGLELGFGMLIENPNAGFAVEGSQYHLTALAEDGRVLATEGGYVKRVLPNQILGVAGTTYLIEETEVARVEAQILAGDFVASDPVPPFAAESVTYRPDPYFPKVAGRIVSPYDEGITDVRVSAILYDDMERIIGGGFTYLDLVPANGTAEVEVSVTSGGPPAAAELHAAVSGLSESE